jgi:hypothetical protein
VYFPVVSSWMTRRSASLTTIFAEYLTGDQFSDICRVALADTASDDVLLGPGEYVLTWKRHGSHSSLRSDSRLTTRHI